MTDKVIQGDFSGKKPKILRTVGGSRKPNDELRGRSNLTSMEIESICKTIRAKSRNPVRDELLVLAAYHHGFRISELTALKWQHIDFATNQLSVKRIKNGIDTTHPISHKRELMLFRRLHKAAGKPATGFVFINERGSPVSQDGFRKAFTRFSKAALGVPWFPHSLRHSCGSSLVDKGISLRAIQIYMGHKSIQSTTVYCHLSTKQFENIEW